MASKAELSNMALGHIGVIETITDFDKDASESGKVIRQFFNIALEKLMRDFEWSFSKTVIELALVTDDPSNPNWQRAFRYPDKVNGFGVINVIELLSGDRYNRRGTRISWEPGVLDGVRVIYTDEPEAVALVSFANGDTDSWPSDFSLAFSAFLGFLVAPALAKGENEKKAEAAFSKYSVWISEAMKSDSSESQRDPEQLSSLEEARYKSGYRRGYDFGNYPYSKKF